MALQLNVADGMDGFMTLKNAFALFDADGDGKLTEDEVVAVLTRKTPSGTKLSEEAARAAWPRWQLKYDLNKDGKISYEELAKGRDRDIDRDGPD